VRAGSPNWSPWLLGDHVIVVITNQTQNSPLVGRSALEAAALVACYTLALLAAALFAFRRRDIA
jgi:ABC-type transport system involved in multi-copper enzyme maturation permease subunit